MMTNPETAPKIDWDYYKARIPVQGMVDDFRKKYGALNIPYPSDSVTPQIDQQENQSVSTYTFGSAVEISDKSIINHNNTLS
jgi:hypothetical protein